MNQLPWLEDRRWRWRVIVLVIVLVVIAALIWHGEGVLGAASGALLIFWVAGTVINWVINQTDSPPPPKPRPAMLNQIAGALTGLPGTRSLTALPSQQEPPAHSTGSDPAGEDKAAA